MIEFHDFDFAITSAMKIPSKPVDFEENHITEKYIAKMIVIASASDFSILMVVGSLHLSDTALLLPVENR